MRRCEIKHLRILRSFASLRMTNLMRARKPISSQPLWMTCAAVSLFVWWLAGCSASSGRDTERLEFWALGREGEVVTELIPEFERRNPGIKVDVQQIPWTAAHEKLLTAYVGDSTPDLAQLGNTWIPEFDAIGALENLNPLIASSSIVNPDDYFAGIWATNVIGDVVYGVPWYVDTRLLFYRKDLLAAAGASSAPRTWSEWIALMQRMKERGGKLRYPILLPTNEWQHPVILALELGAELLADGGRHGAFTEPRFTKAFELYVDLFRKGYAPTLSNSQVANRYQQFAQGEFAMFITGPWDVGEFRRRLPAELQDQWMTAPMPAPDGTSPPGVSLAGGSSLVIFRGSPRKAAAWKLIEFLSEPAQQIRFYELTADLPPRKAAWKAPALADDPYISAFGRQLEHVVPTPKIPEWEQIATAIFEHAEAAIRGEMTTRQALVSLDRKTNRILAKRRWVLARRAG